MARQKKNGTYLNVCIDSEIYEQLSQFCDKAGQTKTVAVERALLEYLLYYQNQATDSDKLIRIIEEQNPLGYPRKGIYAYKFKKFLCSIALGMMPSKEWDGHDEANGGYVIVKDNGEVLAYHIYNRDAFEKYLLNNTKFERGSTGKHGFATLYMENGKRYINLNLQIRFI